MLPPKSLSTSISVCCHVSLEAKRTHASSMLLSLLRDGSLGRSAAKDGGPLAEAWDAGKTYVCCPSYYYTRY